MILNSLKNFFKCLAYVLVPLGCLFIGVLFGVNAAFGIITEQIIYIRDEVVKLIPVAVENVDELWGFVLSSVRELTWKSPFDVVRTILDGEWLVGKISGFVGLTSEQSVQFLSDVQILLQTVASELILAVGVFFALIVLSAIAGYFVTNLFVRSSTVKRGFWKFLAMSLLDALFSATLIAFTTWILTVWKPGALISSLISVLVFGFVSLIEAYLIHGRGKIPFRRAVNFKNCLLLYLSHIIITVSAFVLLFLVFLATNVFVGIAVGYSILIIALLVININAESYIVELTKQNTEPDSEPPPPSAPVAEE